MRSDYLAAAGNALGYALAAIDEGDVSGASYYNARAQALATMAVAEAQREANELAKTKPRIGAR